MSRMDDFLQRVKIEDYESRYRQHIHDDLFFGFPIDAAASGEEALFRESMSPLAYFSMEYGLATSFYNAFQCPSMCSEHNMLSENDIFSNNRVQDYLFSLPMGTIMDLPIYSGGLGVLAGDTVKTAADLRLPLAAVGILWNKGYFRQRFWFKFGQLPEETKWDPWTFPGLVPLKDRVKLELKDRDIHLRLWKYYVYSRTKDYAVPLILLDSNVEENDPVSRKLTDRLYRSDDVDGRLLQRIILGMGGMKALEVLGYKINLYHLNEGHAAFAFVQKARQMRVDEYEDAKWHFAYTCHTPVPAGHDRFNLGDVERILKPGDVSVVKKFGVENPWGGQSPVVNLTLLAINTSRSVNAVSKKHGDVMRLQFPLFKDRIDHVTNGIHLATWMSESIARALSEYEPVLGHFLTDPASLANVLQLKSDAAFRQKLWQAHQANKKGLCELLGHWKLKEDVFTIAWARRIAAYKRPSLLLQDLNRLRKLAQQIGPLQILFAGKAHPNDNLAFTYINEIMNTIDRADGMDGELKIIMLENYDIGIARTLVASVDVWLNNPLPPYEASGTSGMKAIANGVLQMSTLDGWVLEADPGVGRFFGYKDQAASYTDGLNLRFSEDSAALYDALADMMKIYYQTNQKGSFDASSPWMDMMIQCLADAAVFNTHRMIGEYQTKIWRRAVAG